MFLDRFFNTSLMMCILAVSRFAADNPFAGTWKLNPAKSKLTGSPMGTSATVKTEADADSLKVTVEAANADGSPNNFNYQATLDGKPTKVDGSSMIDTITLKRVNDHTISATGSKAGKQVYSDRRVISKDGKTMTITRSGTNGQGKKYRATLAFDKQ